MMAMDKGQSPFYPGQPVPVELFVGASGTARPEIIKRRPGQVERGKRLSIFVQASTDRQELDRSLRTVPGGREARLAADLRQPQPGPDPG